jgi:hypothetical protein
MTKQWHIYELPPIDFLWEMLPTTKEVLKKFIDYEGFSKLSEFIKAYHNALDMARKVGWEGDFRSYTPRIFWLPDDTEFSYAFVWKQDNNGTTYVVSPYRLIWLEELASEIFVAT